MTQDAWKNSDGLPQLIDKRELSKPQVKKRRFNGRYENGKESQLKFRLVKACEMRRMTKTV